MNKGITAVVATLAAAFSLTPADAEEEAHVRVAVAALSTVVGPDGDRPADLSARLLVHNGGAGAVNDLTVLAEVFQAVSSRNELHRAVDDGDPRSRFLADRAVEVRGGGRLASDDVAGIEVVIPAAAIGWGRSGVYPVRFSVLQGRRPLDDVVTAVVRLAEPPLAPLATVVGWPLDAPPQASSPAGRGPEPAAVVADRRRVGRLVAALENAAVDLAGELPVQPLLGAHLLEDLHRAPRRGTAVDPLGLLGRIRAVAATAAPDPVAAPYADADLAGLADQGLGLEALQHVTEGRRRLEESLGTRPQPDVVWATTPIDRQVVSDVLLPSRTRTVVMGWEQLEAARDAKPRRTPPAVVRLPGPGPTVLAAVGDPWLSDVLADLPAAHGDVVTAQRVVAETAMVFFERPSDRGRGLVVLPPPRWDAPPSALSRMLVGLAAAPWLRLTDVPGAVAAAGGDAPVSRLRSGAGAVSTALARDIFEGRRRLATLQAALIDADGPHPALSWERIDEGLLRASSRWWLADGDARSRDLLATVAETMRKGFGDVELPEGARVTLADREGEIPVTLTRPQGGNIRLVVRLESPPRLEFPRGASREVVLRAGGRQTISFPAVAHASGRIPVSVVVTAASDGEATVVLTRSTVVVQSAALSRPAIAVIGGVLAGLLTWGHLRRRPRPTPLSVVRDEAA